ncbi:MAG: hypothetical protein K0U78_10000 [Actinomycetia bacterium]|nr:hypothetical protein [Actinomycetes bacterium]
MPLKLPRTAGVRSDDLVIRGGDPALPTHRYERGLVALFILQICALTCQVLAAHLARRGHSGVADILSHVGMAVLFGSALWVLTRPQLTLLARNTAVACLAVTPTLMWRATDPLQFSGFDEQLHLRTLRDIISSHRLFEANPVLEISPRYPGLEAVTVVFHQLGMPALVAAVIFIPLARLVLVAVLCDAVEQLTGSVPGQRWSARRAGGLAVAVYAVSPQFVWFNSQYSYQTLALPLALAAVSLISRARTADKPFPLFGGATVCLLGVAVTHHLTSFLTAAFLLVWMAAERGPAKMRVAYGALAAVASTVAWAIVQRSTLEQYFAPMISDLASELSGGVRRTAFEDSAGTATPPIDQVLLLYYAAALTLTALALTTLTVRWVRRREHDLNYWNPQLLVLALSVAIPFLLAARIVPKGVEIFTRSSSFLFLPMSFVVVNYMRRLNWWGMAQWKERPAGQSDPEPSTLRTVGQVLAITLAAGVFLGGYVLGSGPEWARLPGPYKPAADSRSIDAENLAAAQWAGQALPPGSRIAADRVSSVLLAANAGLWPVYGGLGGIRTPELYVAEDWGMSETDKASALKIRYVYVDRRLASELPPFGYYFETGEVGEGQQLTDAQLTKFDRVPAIKEIYRHGPVSIYDLKGLGLPEFRNGWQGTTPTMGAVKQLAVGLMVGLLLALVMRSRIWPRVVEEAVSLRQALGPALIAAVVMASVCLVSVALLLAHVWLTPLIALSALAMVVLANPCKTISKARQVAAKVTWRRVAPVALVAVPVAVIMALAVLDAAREDITRVHQILNDPTAVHISPNTPSG